MTPSLTAISTSLAELGDKPAWSLGDEELVSNLTALFQVEQRAVGLRLAWLAELDARGVPVERGAANTVSWLRGVLLVGASAAGRMLGLARGLRKAPATAEALTAGDINAEQALAVVDVLRDLPDDVDPDVPGKVEQALLDQAAVIDAAGLRTLGARALAHAAPEI